MLYIYSLAGGSDYEEINATAPEAYLFLDGYGIGRQQSFSVTLIDDPFFELDEENFMLELRVDPFFIIPTFRDLPLFNIILSPNTTTIDIIDNEGIIALMTPFSYSMYATIVASGVVIGFLNTSYTVNETDGLVNIQIGIINPGILRTSVAVTFSVQSDLRGKLSLL